MDTMKDWRKLPRRRHSDELKAQVLAECAQPGASVAAVALAHGLNANVVHKWRRQGGTKTSLPVTTFVPVAMAAQADAATPIRIELRRGATAVTVAWPLSAAAECAAWMRELLR
jgi:transposase